MKKNRFYTFIIILLAGCTHMQSSPAVESRASNSSKSIQPIVSTATGSMISTPVAPTRVNPITRLDKINAMLLPYLTSGSSDINWERISNNGQWFIHGENLTPGLYKSERDNQKTRITFKSVDYFNTQNEFMVVGDFDFYGFSPDGKSALLEQPEGVRCVNHDFVLFEEDKGQWDGPYFHRQPDNGNNCYEMQWSEDGSQLAVYSQFLWDRSHVMIFDKKAQLLQQFDVHKPNVNSDEKSDTASILFWNGTDYVWVMNQTFTNYTQKAYTQQAYTQQTQIFAFSSLHPEKITHLLDLPGEYYVIGKEPGSNRLLITSFEQDNCNTLVFNPDKKQIEKRVTIDTGCYNEKRSSDNQRIAVVNQKDDGDHLLIWDWGTLTFQDKGIIKWLLSWQSDLQGFLVEKQDNQQKLFFDVIYP
jgi:hypothetical protein